jgi:hypothetical protein
MLKVLLTLRVRKGAALRNKEAVVNACFTQTLWAESQFW